MVRCTKYWNKVLTMPKDEIAAFCQKDYDTVLLISKYADFLKKYKDTYPNAFFVGEKAAAESAYRQLIKVSADNPAKVEKILAYLDGVVAAQIATGKPKDLKLPTARIVNKAIKNIAPELVPKAVEPKEFRFVVRLSKREGKTLIKYAESHEKTPQAVIMEWVRYQMQRMMGRAA